MTPRLLTIAPAAARDHESIPPNPCATHGSSLKRGNRNEPKIFVPHTVARPLNGKPLSTFPHENEGLLTNKQHACLAEYIRAFLSKSERRPYFDQNPGQILESLLSPDRLSIALMPVDKHLSCSDDHRVVHTWYYKYVKRYSRRHKDFLNDLGRALKAKLFTAKLLRHRREANIRDFLGVLARTAKKPPAEQRFFDGFDSNTSLLKQGVRVWDCQDYSSGRGYDEGAIVNKIVLSRNGGRVAFFLKGLGRIRKSKIEAHGIRGFENFEVTALAAAKIVGLNSIECKRYLDDADVTMVGYTLFQEIVGVNTNMLFRRLPGDTFAIQPPFAHLRDRLIREFAQVAALSDLLRKGDRKIVQPLHPEYDANCLVNLQLLHGHPRRRAIWAIDHNHLFQSDNQGVLHDLRYGKCPEMGIVTAFDEFYSGSSARLKLLETFERAYLAQWRRIQSNGPALEKLISQQHGQQSAEYRIFRESLAADPRLEFRAQKVELLRASAGSPAGTMKSKQTRRIG